MDPQKELRFDPARSLGTTEAPHSQVPASIFKQDSPNLDLLRALAVLFVLFSHLMRTLAPSVRGPSSIGHFGVLIFFVHTSLVLMLSLQRMGGADGSVPFLAFYTRRAFRIYPLAIFSILCAFVSGFSALNSRELWSNLSLTMNLTESKAAIVPLWSLPYEVDMYLFLPVLFLFAVRFRSAWATLSLIPAFAILAFLQLHWSPRLDLVQYVGCFIPGIIAYQLSWRPRFRWPAALWPVLLIFLAVVFAGGSALQVKPQFLLRWSVCLVLGLAASQFRSIPDGRLRSGAAIVAKYSYGIYLLHAFAIELSFVRMVDYPAPLRVIAFVAMMFAFPFAAYHLIEKPGIDLGKRLLAELPGAHFVRPPKPAIVQQNQSMAVD